MFLEAALLIVSSAVEVAVIMVALLIVKAVWRETFKRPSRQGTINSNKGEPD